MVGDVVLIDYLVAAALAISGMLALLVLGGDIIQMNTQAREYWQAKSALADFEARWQLSGSPMPTGSFCEVSSDGWVTDWCSSEQVETLPNVCVFSHSDTSLVSMSWGLEGCDAAQSLSVSRGF
ncbi:hypothetical protein N9393_02755 [Luminiphilus sp.]|nr:hypothetical protein [Luminiphilus sp.]